MTEPVTALRGSFDPWKWLCAFLIVPIVPMTVLASELASPAVSTCSHVDRWGDPLPVTALARLGTVRFRHAAGLFVLRLAYGPDSKTVLSAGDDGTVRLWEVATGKEMYQIHAGGSIGFSPDGKLAAATADLGHSVHVWRVETGKDQSRIGVADGERVRALVFSPDSKSLATGGEDGTVRQWDALSGKLLRLFPGPECDIHAIAFGEHGRLLVLGKDKSGDVILWDAAADNPTRRLLDNTEASYVEFTRDGAYLATCGLQGAVLWDAATGKELAHIGTHWGVLAFSSDGKTLALAEENDHTVRLYDIASRKVIQKWEVGNETILCFAFAPDGKSLATGGDYNAVRIWDIAKGKECDGALGHGGAVAQVVFSPDGRGVASVGGDSCIRFWDSSDGREVGLLPERGAGIGPVAWEPDGRSLAFGTEDGTVCLCDPKNVKEVKTLLGHKKGVLTLAWSASGDILASKDRDNVVRLWDPNAGKELHCFGGQEDGRITQYMGLSPDGRLLAMAEENNICLWDTETGKELRRWSLASTTRSRWIEFTPDGHLLLVLGEVDGIHVCSVAEGKEVRQFAQTNKQFYSAALTASGRLVALGGEDGTISLWEVETGGEVREFQAHPAPVCCLSFSVAGDRLASGSDDTTVLIWDVTGRLKDGVLRPEVLGPDELNTRWQGLADRDAAKAYPAVWALAAAPDQSIPFIRERLMSLPTVESPRATKLLADLNADSFDTREKAESELQALGEAPEPYLRKLLADGPASAEQAERVRRLLGKLESSLERLRLVRSIEVLEYVGSREATEVVRKLSKGRPDAWLTQEAAAALSRLERRSIQLK